MPMYWTFNCFLGCIYTVYHIVFLVLNWLSNLEFWLPKKKDQVAQIGVRGGLGNSGNARKKTFFFFQLISSLASLIYSLQQEVSLLGKCGKTRKGRGRALYLIWRDNKSKQWVDECLSPNFQILRRANSFAKIWLILLSTTTIWCF